jgi:methanogenic corrinoid protein MtbC1
MDILNAIHHFEQSLYNLDKIGAQRLLAEAGKILSPQEILSKIVVPSLERIGNCWQEGSIALSQIYMSGKICEQLIDELLPPASTLRKDQPKMGIAVLNDYHFLGKRIVYSHIRSAGFNLTDYGRKTVDELVDCIYNDEIEIILISTLMYPSALNVRQVKDKLDEIAPMVKIIVGGAPFNMDDQLWKAVGADAMAFDGGEALLYINKMLEVIK